MLPAEVRLRSGREIGEALQTGRRGFGGQGVSVVVQDSPPSPTSEAAPQVTRVAFAVGKNVGGAVIRNRVRRRLRHAVAGQLAGWPAGLNVVVRADARAVAAGYDDLVRAVGRGVKRAVDAAGRPAGPAPGRRRGKGPG